MNITEIESALTRINQEVDILKIEARRISRMRDRALAEEKIAAMPDAEKAALLALLKGE